MYTEYDPIDPPSSSDGENLTYQSTQYVNPRRRRWIWKQTFNIEHQRNFFISSQRKPGLRSYRSFCSDLTEALFEEEEEEEEKEVEEESEEEIEKGSEGICERGGNGKHQLDWDSLGVLGLASKLSRDTKSRYCGCYQEKLLLGS